MKVKKFGLLCLLLVCLVPLSALAQCGTVLRVPSRVITVNHAVVNHGYSYNYNHNLGATYTVPTYSYYDSALLVPLFTLGHYQSTTPESLAVLAEIKKLRQDHNALLKVLSRAQKGNVEEPSYVAILRDNCASCHSGASPKGKFAMFRDDQLVSLSQSQYESIIDRVSADDATAMPPNKKMGQRDASRLVIGIVQKFQSAKAGDAEQKKMDSVK